jgi:hypothetical protein
MERSRIRLLYLYVFALVGLMLVAIGTVRIVDIGLKVFIFKQADQPSMYIGMSPYPPIVVDTEASSDAKYSEKITAEQKEALNRWMADYKNWEEQQKKIDYVASERERTASNLLAMILVGLPLYAYHWRIIRKEAKENNS